MNELLSCIGCAGITPHWKTRMPSVGSTAYYCKCLVCGYSHTHYAKEYTIPECVFWIGFGALVKLVHWESGRIG